MKRRQKQQPDISQQTVEQPATAESAAIAAQTAQNGAQPRAAETHMEFAAESRSNFEEKLRAEQRAHTELHQRAQQQAQELAKSRHPFIAQAARYQEMKAAQLERKHVTASSYPNVAATPQVENGSSRESNENQTSSAKPKDQSNRERAERIQTEIERKIRAARGQTDNAHTHVESEQQTKEREENKLKIEQNLRIVRSSQGQDLAEAETIVNAVLRRAPAAREDQQRAKEHANANATLWRTPVINIPTRETLRDQQSK